MPSYRSAFARWMLVTYRQSADRCRLAEWRITLRKSVLRSISRRANLFALSEIIKPDHKKYCSSVFQKFMIMLSRPASAEGHFAIATDVRRRDAVDARMLSALVRADEIILADGEGCGLGPDAGIKSRG